MANKTSQAVLCLFALIAATAASAQTPDSILAVSSGGQSRFRVNVNGGAFFGGAWDGFAGSGGIPAEGAGTRMIWYPEKAAFRAGRVTGTEWDDANIGYFSIAAGEDVSASGRWSSAFGRGSVASGDVTFAAGEDAVASGQRSVALGYRVSADNTGTFIFGSFASGTSQRTTHASNSATWWVTNGFRIYTGTAGGSGVTIQSGAVASNWGQSNALISTSTGAYLHTNGTWTNSSDVNRKHRFHSVNGEDVLTRLRGLRMGTWTYLTEPASVRHLGPTAQDFRQAFGLGDDDRVISTVDADGVALAGVQALDGRTVRQQAEIDALRAENADLRALLERERGETRARLARLEALVAEPSPGVPSP